MIYLWAKKVDHQVGTTQTEPSTKAATVNLDINTTYIHNYFRHIL